VATLDFFAPLVDDPYTYGAIAAANAMSDVFAMGGEVVLALNIAAFPESLPPKVQTEILRGGADKVLEAGGVIAGGHTIWDDEPKYGLSVLGLVHPGRLFSKAGLRPGDHLYLTKPLGTGVIIASRGTHPESERWMIGAIASMLRLNRHPAHLAREAGVTAATDVTGFGLLGHLWEMVDRSGVAATIDANAVPLLPGALESAAAGGHTGGEGRNRDWAAPHVSIDEQIPPHLAALLYDPQTSGGLLIACGPDRAASLEAAFFHDDEHLSLIGRVTEGRPHINVVS
jgi:selenide,water dikinase